MHLQFAKLEDAKAAQSLNGKVEIAGRTIKVRLCYEAFYLDITSVEQFDHTTCFCTSVSLPSFAGLCQCSCD